MSRTKQKNDNQLQELLAAMSQEMTNGAAIGYMIMAAQALSLDHKIIQDMESIMSEQMDFYSEEQAEHVYQTFY